MSPERSQMIAPYTVRMPLTSVKVDYSINGREEPTSADSSYNLPALITQIIDAMRILTVIGVEKLPDGTYRVIDGFRRMAAALRILAMQKPEEIPQEKWDTIQANLREMDFMVYEGLSDDERNQILFNHGTQSALTRVETVKQVWRSSAAGNTTQQIYNRLFTVLLALSGKREQEKLKTELSSLSTERERQARITKFFKGKIQDYFLDAYYLGEYVQKCVIETEAGRMKPKGEKTIVDGVELFKSSQPRIVELSAAKRRDVSKDGKDGKSNPIADWDATKDGLGWNPKEGGIRFNAKIAEFLKADAGSTTPRETPMDMKDMENRKVSALSSVAKLAFTLAKGEPLPDGADLLASDANAGALEEIQRITLANLVTLEKADKRLYNVFAAIAVPDNSGKKFAESLAEFLKPLSEDKPVSATELATEPAPLPKHQGKHQGKGQRQHAR